MNEWTKGYLFGCIITLWFVWLAFHFTGCRFPQHVIIPCNADNCGKLAN